MQKDKIDNPDEYEILRNLIHLSNKEDANFLIWPESSIDFIDLDNIDQVERFRKDFKSNYPFNSKELIFGTITKKNHNFYLKVIQLYLYDLFPMQYIMVLLHPWLVY